MKLLRGLVVFLSLMLLIAPPGGAVCWPLPGGHHLHIGWNDSEGEATLDLTVFTHRASESVGDSHGSSFTPAASSELPGSGVLLPRIQDWFLPLITLAWLLVTQAIFPSLWQLQSATPPPRRTMTPPPRRTMAL